MRRRVGGPYMNPSDLKARRFKRVEANINGH
jgi:hypothetical protein